MANWRRGWTQPPDEQAVLLTMRERLCADCPGYARCWAGEDASAVRLFCQALRDAACEGEAAEDVPPELLRALPPGRAAARAGAAGGGQRAPAPRRRHLRRGDVPPGRAHPRRSGPHARAAPGAAPPRRALGRERAFADAGRAQRRRAPVAPPAGRAADGAHLRRHGHGRGGPRGERARRAPHLALSGGAGGAGGGAEGGERAAHPPRRGRHVRHGGSVPHRRARGPGAVLEAGGQPFAAGARGRGARHRGRPAAAGRARRA